MVVLAMLAVATMARGLLMPSLRLMLVCTMEDMEDMVLDMAVPSMVKHLIYASKSSKVILLLFSAQGSGWFVGLILWERAADCAVRLGECVLCQWHSQRRLRFYLLVSGHNHARRE